MQDGIKKYDFHKTKYGDELLIDIVELKDIKKYLQDKPLHKLAYYDITLITEGDGKFSIDDKIYTVEKGDIIFTQPNQARAWDTNSILNGYALIFEEEFLLAFFNDPLFLKRTAFFNRYPNSVCKLSLSDENDTFIKKLLEEIKKEISAYKEKDKHILRALLYQSIKYLERIYSMQSVSEKRQTNGYTEKFIHLVESDFREEHSVKFYADKLCISPEYLYEVIKSSTGKTAKQIIQDKLLNEAKRLLIYTELNINEISENIGFENTSYFIRFFRKYTGSTPLNFRKSIKP